MEFIKELNGIRGSIAVTPQELETNKLNLIRSLPGSFETNSDIANQLASIVTFGLPNNYYDDLARNIRGVTLADISRVSNKYLTPDRMAILIVGDKALIEPRLREIDSLGKTIYYLDADGNPVPAGQ